MFNLYIKVNDKWELYGSYKTYAVANIHKGLIMNNETKIVEED